MVTFYRPYKLGSQFSTRSRLSVLDSSGLVYRFECPNLSCKDIFYYGYTAQKLSSRIKQHRYQGSSIYEHFIHDHNESPPKFDQFSKNFTILFRNDDVLKLKIAEAILIKNDKPFINVKFNQLYDFLKLF